MRSKLPFTMSFPMLLWFATMLQGQTVDEDEIRRAAAESLLRMPEPPLEYAVTKNPIGADGKLLGFQVQVIKEDAVSKVVVKIETRDLSDRGSRVAACKGYVNGLASDLKNAGFKLTRHKLPDIENADFKTPLSVELVFANDEGTNLFVNKRIFFTIKGFDVTVIATDEKDLQALTAWALQIEPARARP